jgi:alcohol dehydrogenase
MLATQFLMTPENHLGRGCLPAALNSVKSRGLRHALLVTDAALVSLGLAHRVAEMLRERDIEVTVFSGVQPNPTSANVDAGLAALKAAGCDCVVSLGGGSPHDCAKLVATLATNGGAATDYRGLNKLRVSPLPLVAINTTAGTASEMTRFAVVTDEARHVKTSIVDARVAPLISVNDAELMLGLPPAQTAATGMDALTHAVEAYVSTLATPVTDACALHAIRLIGQFLPRAVAHGQTDLVAREQMASAQFLAGMAFNSAFLGYVHAMAHPLGAIYDLPHGLCNALLLPHVEAVNASVCAARLADVARALGVDTAGMDAAAAAQAAVQAIRRLSAALGLPRGLGEVGVRREDLPAMAAQAMKDGAGRTNPKALALDEVIAIYEAAY